MLTITQKNLCNALSLVQNTVQKNATSEYQQCVLIKHFGEQLQFQTTSVDASTVSTVQEFQGSLEHELCVNFEDLFEIITRYKADEDLTLGVSVVESQKTITNKDGTEEEITEFGKYLTLSKGTRSFAELPTLDAQYFPQILSIGKEESKIVFHKEDLRSAISKAHFCMYANETRYNINGLHFNFQSESKKIDVVSTDGHRLAKFEIEDAQLKFDEKITIPRKIVVGIKKDIDHAHSEIIFKINGGKLQIDFGSHTLITKLIDADFPDYNRVIPTDRDVIIDGVVKPKDHNAVIKIQKPSFAQSLDRVHSILLKNTEPAVRMDFQNNKLSMSCVNDQKKAKEVLDCEFEGQHSLCVNASYIKECLQGITSKEFEISVKEGVGSYPIKIQDAEDKRFLYIIMPMKI